MPESPLEVWSHGTINYQQAALAPHLKSQSAITNTGRFHACAARTQPIREHNSLQLPSARRRVNVWFAWRQRMRFDDSQVERTSADVLVKMLNTSTVHESSTRLRANGILASQRALAALGLCFVGAVSRQALAQDRQPADSCVV